MKPNTLIKFDYETLPKEYHIEYLKKFPKNDVFVFLGKINKMNGASIVCNYKTGEIICGYNIDNFTELKEIEI